MSFNRLNYDVQAYKKSIDESVGPGVYNINVPRPDGKCTQCYPAYSTFRAQKQGVSVDNTYKWTGIPIQSLVDVESDLKGQTRKISKVPSKNFMPSCKNFDCVSGQPCGSGVTNECKAKYNNAKKGAKGGDKNLMHWKDCFFPSESTRLSNPPCTLRSTGWNRWEWLCQDPQDKCLIPFDHNINNRLIVKDNHRPCIPTPIDQTLVLPKGGPISCNNTTGTCGVPTRPSSVNWRSKEEISQY